MKGSTLKIEPELKKSLSIFVTFHYDTRVPRGKWNSYPISFNCSHLLRFIFSRSSSHVLTQSYHINEYTGPAHAD